MFVLLSLLSTADVIIIIIINIIITIIIIIIIIIITIIITMITIVIVIVIVIVIIIIIIIIIGLPPKNAAWRSPRSAAGVQTGSQSSCRTPPPCQPIIYYIILYNTIYFCTISYYIMILYRIILYYSTHDTSYHTIHMMISYRIIL